jgi:hypothetical protein
MYLVYNIDQIHKLFNKFFLKKLLIIVAERNNFG